RGRRHGGCRRRRATRCTTGARRRRRHRMASSGLHSNGYSLARHVLLSRAGLALDAHVDELGRTLGEELLVPTRVYSLDCLALINAVDVHAFSHVTGGGLAANLDRVLPTGVDIEIDRTTW